MIHSMTGFAVHTLDTGRVRLHLECRSVNSRYLDLSFRLADDMRQAEPILREEVGKRLSRGKVECRLTAQKSDAAQETLVLNSGVLTQLGATQAALQKHFPDAAAMSVAEMLRWPGVLSDDSPDFEQLKPVVAELAKTVLEDLVVARRREGDKLATMIRERIVRMRELIAPLVPRIPALVAEYQEKLVTRLREAAAMLDEDRVRQEIVFFAQRIDVDEELSRLGSHLDEVERILATGGAAGKRLDFLMQELNREANTLASKSIAADVSNAAVELKLLIEQMREQVQNIE